MWYALGLSVSFLVGMGLMCLLKRQPDEECRLCKANFNSIIGGLEDTIHGLKSTKGKLSVALQNKSFMDAGFRAR